MHQSQLAEALAPSPARVLSELHSLLPDLARAAYTRFVCEVRGLAEAVTRPPGSAEEFVGHMALVKRVEGRRAELGAAHDHVGQGIVCLESLKPSACAGRVDCRGMSQLPGASCS